MEAEEAEAQALTSLAILTFITFVGNFTQLQLTSALPQVVSDFGITVTLGQWLTSVFQLVMGVMVPLTAFLTRRFSTRQIVITSMAVFTVGSALSWLAPSFAVVLTGRTLEAVGTGIMWPLLQITVFAIYPLSRRGVAMGTVGMAMSVAPALGPTFGGWQTDVSGWRSIFLSMMVLGVVSLLLASLGMRNFGVHDPDVHADFFSVGLSVIGFGGLMFGFTNIQAYPIVSPMTGMPMVVGAGGVVWFVLRQIRSRQPLLDLSVLRNPRFTVGTICASMVFFAFSSILVILPIYIQSDRGYSATISGLLILPGAFGMAISQFFGGRALDRFGVRPVALAGTIVLTLGTFSMSMIDTHTWIWWISICQFIRQVGMGFVLMPVTTWSLNCLPSHEVSAGSAVTNTIRQIAGAVGSPVLVITMETLTTLHHAALGDGADTQIAANIFGVQWTIRLSALICMATVILVYFGVRGESAGSGRAVTLYALRRMRQAGIPLASKGIRIPRIGGRNSTARKSLPRA